MGAFVIAVSSECGARRDKQYQRKRNDQAMGDGGLHINHNSSRLVLLILFVQPAEAITGRDYTRTADESGNRMC